jgi:N-acetylglucosaminyldiphosphoundecaprenol N-acetyl-beta-D-mannosaminyltransferase
MQRSLETIRGARVLGARIHVADWRTALDTLARWARARDSRYVCICNVHSIVTASRDPAFATALEGADLATPDGAPVAWMLRRLGFSRQQRINGPDLMWKYCAEAGTNGTSVFLYGSTPETLMRLREALRRAFPDLQIAGSYSPPFRALSAQEDAEVVDMINASGAGVVWVSLGCPKQELWMAEHRDQVSATMVGVGAAFDYIAGTVKRAPHWMQRAGLEWLHRLASEPRRLWRRYLITNSLFAIGAARQLGSRLLSGDR